MGKTKDFLKVSAVVAIIIALLGTLYMGINRLALTAATSRTEVLPRHAASVSLPDPNPEMQEVSANGGIPFERRDVRVDINDAQPAQLNESFITPRLTIFENPYQHYHVIPPYALSIEDAALIGAYYIWDVFGRDIDGMYVRMMYSAHQFLTRSLWTGAVSTNLEALIPQEGAAGLYIRGRMYQFVIDGITGERIDIWRFSQDQGPPTQEELNAHANFRDAVVQSGWFEMSLEEQKDKIGLTPDLLAAYTQAAKELASRHFNTSSVVEIFLGDNSPNPVLTIDGGVDENGEEIFVLTTLMFTAIDDTGREALITIPALTAGWRFPGTTIATMHNDFMPGFFYYGGIG